jgi:enterochelin esterase family protein
LWAVTVDLPAGSRIEYKLEVVSKGHRTLILDPLNKVIAQDPFGANSVCQGDGYQRPNWTLNDPEALQGALHQVKVASKSFAEERDLQIYLPARFRRNRRYPLLIVHDGSDYMQFAALGTVLDNLIHNLEIPPMIVAMTQSPDRLIEYAANDKHAAFIAEDVLSFMESNYPLIDKPQERGIMGASFGAVATLHTAWRYPGRFARLLLQSGSFAFSDLGQHKRGPVFDPVVSFMNEFREAPGIPSEKMYMSCGIYESLIYENRSLLPLLQRQQIDVQFEEVRDAHNWENWRDRLQVGISSLFPGPMWMVYE